MMKSFKYFFKTQFRSLLNTITIILAILYFAVSLYFVHDGIDLNKSIQRKMEHFKKIEQSKVEKHMNYSRYGAQGFRVLYVSSPLSIFLYNAGVFAELTANIDVGERLNIGSSLKGKNISTGQPGNHADFFGFFLFCGTLLCAFFGFGSFRAREYLRHLTSFMGMKKVYVSTFAARFSLLALYLSVVNVSALLLVIISRVELTGTQYLQFFTFHGLCLLVGLFMFSLGAGIGCIKSKSTGFAFVIVAWLIQVYGFPVAIDKAVSTTAAKMPSNFQTELEKWDELTGFEIRAIREVGKYSKEKAKTNLGKDLVESYLKGEYKNIQEIEKQVEQEMRNNANLFQWLSILSPTTFCASVSSEMSSKGYGNVISFFSYTQELKDKFNIFYKNKKFYPEPGQKGVESFTPNGENVYTGGSRLPANFLWGLLVLLVQTSLMNLWSYNRFGRFLHRLPREETAKNEPGQLILEESHYRVLKIDGQWFNNHFYNILSHRERETTVSGYTSKIFIGEKELTVSPGSQPDFLYSCHARKIPRYIRVGDYWDLVLSATGAESPGSPKWTAEFRAKTFGQLTKLEMFGLLMEAALLIKKKYVLLYNLTRDMPIQASVELMETMKKLSKAGAVVILLTRDQLVTDSGSLKECDFHEARTWTMQVDQCKQLMEEG
ncbi:MAG: hypothetical protein GY940_08395 [bacterium]|nr:hypothetical protein [bacterium]